MFACFDITFAQTLPVLRLGDAPQSFSFGNRVHYFVDPSKSLTITDVQEPQIVQRFRPSLEDIPNFGFAQSTFWFTFTLQNTTPANNDWLLEIAYQPLDSIELIEYVNGANKRRIALGDMLPYAERLVDTRTYVVPLQLADTLPRTYFLRVNTQSSVQVPLYLHRSARFTEDVSRSELAYGIFFGVMIALILYNLFLFTSLRNIYYLYYILYLLGAMLYISVVTGYAAQYLWGGYPRLANYMNIGAIGVMICGMSVFARHFLLVRRYAPGMAKALVGTIIAGVGIIVGGLVLPYRMGVQASIVVNIVTVVIVVTSGAIVWKRGNISARYFFLAVALFLTGNILFVMKTLGALPTNPVTTHIAEIGVMVEGLLFAFALADRYRQIRIDKEAAQQEALRVEHEANVHLERNVRERTAELEAMNDEMQRQMVILNNQAVEIEMTNVELHEKNLLLENLNHEKNEFMGIAVHDLKSPLQTIIMNISMIRRYRERMDNEQRDYLFERIEETTRRMHDIITNLLDANAIEMGKIEFTPESFLITPELRALTEDYHIKAAVKKIAVHFIAENEHLRAFADKHRTLEVVENLLSNAVKFSPHGKNVWVRLKSESGNMNQETIQSSSLSPQSSSFFCIEIQDEGPGLSDDDKTKMFGKFARLSARPTGGEHSTGLGLSIVKRFVEAMNGQILCTSELGRGATFTVILPRVQGEQE